MVKRLAVYVRFFIGSPEDFKKADEFLTSANMPKSGIMWHRLDIMGRHRKEFAIGKLCYKRLNFEAFMNKNQLVTQQTKFFDEGEINFGNAVGFILTLLEQQEENRSISNLYCEFSIHIFDSLI